jgi:hypothetical protein
MGATLDEFFDQPVESHVVLESSKTKRKRPLRPTTDIELWLTTNGPRTYPELTDLRQSLYRQRTHGGFTISTVSGDRFKVTGRTSSLLIVSDKARHYLLWMLCKMIGTDRRR